MSKPDNHNGFTGTMGHKMAESIQKPSYIPPFFTRQGHLSVSSIRYHREKFMGKSVCDIQKMLEEHGYETKVRPSKHQKSRAMVIEITNPDKHRNISQVQVSPGTPRHGNVPYVKISTKDAGKIKVINGKRKDYKTDDKETATLIFQRNKRSDNS